MSLPKSNRRTLRVCFAKIAESAENLYKISAHSEFSAVKGFL